jgi:hypothetical protein
LLSTYPIIEIFRDWLFARIKEEGETFPERQPVLLPAGPLLSGRMWGNPIGGFEMLATGAFWLPVIQVRLAASYSGLTPAAFSLPVIPSRSCTRFRNSPFFARSVSFIQ